MRRWLPDLVLLCLLGEASALLRSRPRREVATMAPTLGSGLFLVLALRAQGRGRSTGAIAALLMLAGTSHALDLRQRLRR